MKIDEKEILIMQYNNKSNKWEDITTQVMWFEVQDKAYRIRYSSNSVLYWKSFRELKIFSSHSRVNMANKIMYYQNAPILGLSEVVFFELHVKLFYINGKTKIILKKDIEIVSDITSNSEISKFISYLKDVAVLISDDSDINFLVNQLEKLTVYENSVLGKFLQGTLCKEGEKSLLLCPFDANLSQRKAIKKALEEDLSIIQGPPGTGKMATILNIAMNLIARGQSIAILSGNNEAIKNVYEKIEAAGFGFLHAFLGNVNNVTSFFEKEEIPIEQYNKINTGTLKKQWEEISNDVNSFLSYSFDIAKIDQLLSEYEAEKEINDKEYFAKKRTVPKNLANKKYISSKLLELLSVLETLPDKKIGIANRIRFIYKYGIAKPSEILVNKNDSIEYLKNKYYSTKISELKQEKEIKQNFIDAKNLSQLQEDEKHLAMDFVKSCLQSRFEQVSETKFSCENYKRLFNSFVDRYPIIYSTTHAIKNCTAKNYLYDCVIIDEASQVDLISAVLAFSVAKKVVLVGDDKQLPHVVRSNLLPSLKKLSEKYKIDEYFDYSHNSILNCVLKKKKDIPVTLLNEHYRCDPQIIGFCNKRFYNGELIIRSKHSVGDGVTIISHGSHFERDRTNERQVDIIEKEILNDLSFKDRGIIAPYNNQIRLLKERFVNDSYAIDTIHKFQGKEKDCIIISTVANRIKFYEDDEKIDFLNNPNLINVAISRAKRRLYILASDELLSQEGSLLKELRQYYEYYCSETKIVKSKVYSVFDLMYDDYAPILEETKKRLLKISSFTSENIIATIIDDICTSNTYGALSYKFNYPLKYIIKTDVLIDENDMKFVSNINTHCDFVIYNKLNKEIKLVVEVDGSQHKQEVQSNRDKRKDALLLDAGIPILRLTTTSIECKEKIEEKLKESM